MQCNPEVHAWLASRVTACDHWQQMLPCKCNFQVSRLCINRQLDADDSALGDNMLVVNHRGIVCFNSLLPNCCNTAQLLHRSNQQHEKTQCLVPLWGQETPEHCSVQGKCIMCTCKLEWHAAAHHSAAAWITSTPHCPGKALPTLCCALQGTHCPSCMHDACCCNQLQPSKCFSTTQYWAQLHR